MERTWEGVDILLNDVWYSAVIDFGYIGLESYGLDSSFQGLKFV